MLILLYYFKLSADTIKRHIYVLKNRYRVQFSYKLNLMWANLCTCALVGNMMGI